MNLIEKYRPQSLSQLIGQQEAIIKLLSFVKRPTECAAILYGPVGSGKTSCVHALASDFGYELIELNASDLRNKKNIDEIVKKALEQKSLYSKKKIILIDELEGLSGKEDRGGIEELNKVMSLNYPIVITTNNPYDKRFNSLRKKAELIKFEKISTEDIYKLIFDISKKENLTLSPVELKKIAVLSEGDARAAINDLHTFSGNIDALGEREREGNIFNALKLIFKGNSFSATSNALNHLEMDTDEVMLWIDENLPLEYRGKELKDAYYMLSKADIFKQRIIRKQHWRLLVYTNILMTAGIALSKRENKDKYVSYKPIKRLLKIWIANRTEKKSIAKRLTKVMHCSTKKVMREMPYLEKIAENNPEVMKEFTGSQI